jgi:hypothetical protein
MPRIWVGFNLSDLCTHPRRMVEPLIAFQRSACGRPAPNRPYSRRLVSSPAERGGRRPRGRSGTPRVLPSSSSWSSSIGFLAGRARTTTITRTIRNPPRLPVTGPRCVKAYAPLAFRTGEPSPRAMPEATDTIFVSRLREIQFSAGTKRNRHDSVQCLQPSNGRCILNRGTPVRYQNIRASDNPHNSRSGPPCDDRSAESRNSLAQNMPFSRIGC